MEQTSQVIFDKNSIEFVTVAAEYCGFIERARGAERQIFVDTALKILPLLYLKATLIPECEQIGEEDLEVFVTEDDYEKLVNRIKELGMNPEDYSWYLDLRRYGGTTHSGFGLGFERMVMYLTGIANIRDVVPYPRTFGDLKY